MACIQCGACVSDCLSMEVDPLFIGPAALSKAYRFAGDPRDAQQRERVKDLAEDPHGIFDCTHCFKCIEACPKGVAPMSQIMRLRRVATGTHDIEDRNNGARHESAFVSLVKKHGLLWEAELLPRSYGGDNFFGKFAPKAGLEMLESLPVIAKGLLRRKVTPAKAIKGPGDIPREARAEISRIFDTVHGRDEVRELNLYISGYDEDLEGAETPSASAGAAEGQHSAESGQPGMSPEESPTR
jgi:succinate dehydrogenase / fumarate reductase iron-sulfur subunit